MVQLLGRDRKRYWSVWLFCVAHFVQKCRAPTWKQAWQPKNRRSL